RALLPGRLELGARFNAESTVSKYMMRHRGGATTSYFGSPSTTANAPGISLLLFLGNSSPRYAFMSLINAITIGLLSANLRLSAAILRLRPGLKHPILQM